MSPGQASTREQTGSRGSARWPRRRGVHPNCRAGDQRDETGVAWPRARIRKSARAATRPGSRATLARPGRKTRDTIAMQV